MNVTVVVGGLAVLMVVLNVLDPFIRRVPDLLEAIEREKEKLKRWLQRVTGGAVQFPEETGGEPGTSGAQTPDNGEAVEPVSSLLAGHREFRGDHWRATVTVLEETEAQQDPGRPRAGSPDPQAPPISTGSSQFRLIDQLRRASAESLTKVISLFGVLGLICTFPLPVLAWMNSYIIAQSLSTIFDVYPTPVATVVFLGIYRNLTLFDIIGVLVSLLEGLSAAIAYEVWRAFKSAKDPAERAMHRPTLVVAVGATLFLLVFELAINAMRGAKIGGWVAGTAAGAQALGIGLAMEVVGGAGLGFFVIPLFLIVVTGVAFVVHGILRLIFRGPKEAGPLPGAQELLGKVVGRAGGFLIGVAGPTRAKMRWLRFVASVNALVEPLRALDRWLVGLFGGRGQGGGGDAGSPSERGPIPQWGPRPTERRGGGRAW